MNDLPIGVFDSGLGGLTVVHAIYQRLPVESTIYFGDTARVPYGPKSPETVRRYSLEILHWLLAQNVKAVVIACNTSTAHALDALRAESPVPVIGVIGTAGTVASGAYVRAINALAPDTQVVQRACPLFVPLVEEGWFDHRATELIAEEYLAPVRDAGVGALVLGCTHYPLLAPMLQRVMGPKVTLIDSAAETARALADALTEKGIEAPAGAKPKHRFAVSDDAPRFLAVGGRFLGDRLGAAEVVDLTP